MAKGLGDDHDQANGYGYVHVEVKDLTFTLVTT
jgi:hypothetical protein